MNELIDKKEIKIENMIYEIRGVQVMLDSDLAKLYECRNGTKDINKAVNRNIERFPSDFYFKLTEGEYKDILRFQNGTLEMKQGKYSKYLCYVFTEQGVAMLATVIHTEIASKISIQIMRTFSIMRKYISNNLLEQRYINNQVFKNTEDIKLLQESFEKLNNKELSNEIYFEGQIYDAYSKIIDIMNKAKTSLIIIDNYADKIVLDMISKIKVKTVLITKQNNKLTKLNIEKYNKQYNNLTIIYDNTFHDRYLILDKFTLYHCGSSLNHAGNKTFSINKIDDEFLISSLLLKINI